MALESCPDSLTRHFKSVERTNRDMSEQKKWKAPRLPTGTAVDGGVLEKIDAYVQKQDVQVDALAQFLSRGFATQAVQSWSYYAQVNDHQKFTSATGTLSKLLRVVNDHSELVEFGVLIIKEILTGYSKTLYRGLSSMRASITNPILRFLNEIVLFKNSALLDDFIALFDFQLAVLPKLLIPTKTEQSNVAATQEKEHLSIRYCFTRLLVNIVKNSAPLLRKDFLSNNSKIITNWFKFMTVIDSDALIELTLQVWDEKILKEQSFKKATKLKVFNEWNLTKILPIYYSSNKEIRSIFNKFLLSIATDSKYGLKFAHDDAWFLNTSSNSTLNVNQKHFRTHNKMLYGVITNLKPWDDDMQLNTTVAILKSLPELIPPYVNYLASRGVHDPKLSSYWISQTLILSKLIRLDIAEEIVEYTGLSAPSKTIITDLIVPPVLNRSVLKKCLQSETFLIRQLSAQLIMDSMIKLKLMLQLYDSKSWTEERGELINSVYHQLPDLTSIASCVSDSYAKKSDNKVLLVTFLMIMNAYMGIFPDTFNFAQTISKPYMDVINEKEYSSIDLVLLDSFFQLQEGDSSQIKWWSKSGKSQSLFTSLLKIASSDAISSVSSKVAGLLSSLVRRTVIFNYDQVKIDPIIVLSHSLKSVTSDETSEEVEKIWTLLDESVSRCVSTPFKYLDSSNMHNRISPLLITLFEQWKFVDKTTSYKLASKWLVLFLRELIIIGEPVADILELVKDIELDFDHTEYLYQDSFEKNIATLSQDSSLKSESFYEIFTTSPLERLTKAGIPTEDIDIVGALARISSIVNDNSISFKKTEKLFSQTLSKIGDYLYTHPASSRKFSQKKYWSGLYLKNDSQSGLFVSQILVEIFSQLDCFDPTGLSSIVNVLLTNELSEGQQSVVSESLWSLCTEDLRTVLDHSSEILKKGALEMMLQRKATIDSSTVAELLSNSTLRTELSQMVALDLVVFGDVTKLFTAVTQTEDTLGMIKLLAKNPVLLPDLLTFIQSTDNKTYITYVASSLTNDVIESYADKKTLAELLELAKSNSIELIKMEDFSVVTFGQMSTIFTNKLVFLTAEDKEIILDYSLNKTSNKFIPEIPELLLTVSTFEEQDVKTWVNKSVLYLTKIFAEYPEPPSQFFKFLESFKSLVLNISIVSVMSKSHVNALLEVILSKWVKKEIALEFASILVITASRSFLEFGKFLQILANHDDNALLKTSSSPKTRFFTSLLLLRLFEYDVSKNANVSLQDKILTFYCGSTRAEDILLLRILEKLESKLNRSWIDQVFAWDFMDALLEDEEDLVGETRLIENKREGLVITLNKKFVTNGLRHHDVKRHALEPLNQSSLENWRRVTSFYQTVSLSTSSEISKTAYDPLFLSLLLINNDELLSITAGDGEDLTVKCNIKKLVQSDLFASVVLNLSSEDKTTHEVSKTILASMLHTLKEESTTFKEKRLFELFVTKLLYTFEREEYEQLPPMVFSLISNMVSVLSNPGHMLYEKVFRWVLKAPFVKGNDIPLYHEVTTVASTEDTEVYYKQLSWMLESLTYAVKTSADVQLLRNKNVFELVMNLLNSPYLTQRIRYEILALLTAVQDVEGGDILITRFGGLAHLEQCESSLESSEATGIDELQQKQELLNLKELAVRYGIICQKKRLMDWTSGEIEQFTKRSTA